MNFLLKAKNAWRNLWRRSRIDHVVLVESMNDLPKRLTGTLYIIGHSKPKWAVLACPCGCGERIDVNLMENRQPCWRLSMKSGKASLHPSLWMPTEKCGSHFWLRQNRIDWV
jgi:hypothetical protein